MTTRSIKSIVLSLKGATTQAQTDVNDLATKFAGKSRDDIRTTLLPIVGEAYKVALIDGKGKATGTKVFDSTAEDYESARKFLQRILTAIAPTEPKATAQRIDVPRELRVGIIKQIIEAGLTKAQFNALLSQVRDAIDFE